jgi:hypothetical protein
LPEIGAFTVNDFVPIGQYWESAAALYTRGIADRLPYEIDHHPIGETIMIHDIRETGISVYRQYDMAGRVAGYTLFTSGPGAEKVDVIDSEWDRVPQIQVHIFGTHDEADAFKEGLILAGEREIEGKRLQEGWAVLRPVPYEPDGEDDPTVKVITYTAPPRVLVTIRDGVVSSLADTADIDVCIVDYDHSPEAIVPRRFKSVVSHKRDPIAIREGLPEAYNWLERH